MKSRQIYISDIHLNDDRSLRYPDQRLHYGWQNEERLGALAEFLEYISQDVDVDELILLGDILDTWICPINQRPPTFYEILSASCNQRIIELFNRIISKNKKLIYVPGNHDMLVTNSILQKYMPGIIFIEGEKLRSQYFVNDIIAEHGNAFTMFNAPDFHKSKVNAIPLGYYIGRISASKPRAQIVTNPEMQHGVKYIISHKSPELIPVIIMDIILSDNGIQSSQQVILPNGQEISMDEIKRQYSNLFTRWVGKYGIEYASKAAMADLDYLMDAVIDYMKNESQHTFVFGHTHIEKLEKISLSGKSIIYANTGTWCEYPVKPYSFIETETDKINNRKYVRLKNWVEGNVRLVKEVFM